jgi:Ca-activated chloride channel family protein
VRILPPGEKVELTRPTLNISLVIDRSSSMRGRKIKLACQAAYYAIQQLLPQDRISVIAFDRAIRTLVDSTLAVDKEYILRQIQQIQPGYGTALHSGWQAGIVQVIKHNNPQYMNRVILLSDGLISMGERNPNVIAREVSSLAEQGISTTTIGLGNSYDEKLLVAMASQGKGYYYYVEFPEQLPEVFQGELQDLMLTIGHNVSLGIEPQNGVELEDVLSDLNVDRRGRFQLPNLVAGNPIEVVVRLQVPPLNERKDLCYFRLTWQNLQAKQPQEILDILNLPIVNSGQLEEFLPQIQVQQRVALTMAARAKKKAIRLLDQKKYEAAIQLIQEAKINILNTPNSPLIQQEADALGLLEADLQARKTRRFRKRVSHDTFNITLTDPSMVDDLD